MRAFSPDSPWRLDPTVTFLNHGSFGACPVPVLDAQRRLVDDLEADPLRFLGREHDRRIAGARESLGAFLHADPEGLVFVPNATTGVSTVLRSLRFEHGDELLTTDHEYNATINALAEVARASGARLTVASIPLPIPGPDHVVDAILSAVTPRTKLALVSHVTSPTGLVLPIERIVAALASEGVDTLVDAAHAPGQVPVDLEALGAAYWTGNGHKWLCGPKGSAVLHVRADRRDRVRPLVVSHGWNDPTPRPRLWKEFDWTGTTDPTPYLALAEAVGIVGDLVPGGWPGIIAANHELAVAARAMLEHALGAASIAPASMLGSMAAIRLPGLRTDDDAERLELALATEDRIEVPVIGWPVRAARPSPDDGPREVLVRISAQRYNEPDDYVRLADALVRRGHGARARDADGRSAIGASS